ncbi:MAG: hypothetical protein ACOYB8_10230 [Eubacteriaceae bacterium]
MENIFTLVSYRDTKSYDLAIIEINERISRIKDESTRLEEAIKKIESFGQDYNCMTEAQQYELGSYVNLMNSSTQLLVNPIMGLQPKYTEEDLEKYSSERNERILCGSKPLIFFMANLLYNISMDEKDWRLLWKSYKGNKKFLKAMEMEKSDFEYSIMETVQSALKYKYSH